MNPNQAAGSVPHVGGPPQFLNPVTKVQLSVSAKKLRDADLTSKSDPVCVLYWKDIHKNSLHELARTEKIIDSLEPCWVQKFDVDYRFEERQVLQFHIFDWDNSKHETSTQDKLGWTECTLAEIMASGGEPLTRTLNDGKGGIIVVVGEEVVESKEVVTLSFAGSGLDKKDMFGKSDPYLVVSKSVGSNNQYTVVHRTEYIKKTLDPVWKPFVIRSSLLCGGDDQRPLKIECFDYDKDSEHDFIGECFTTLAKLKQGNVSSNHYDLINPKKKAKKSSYKNSGKLMVQLCTVHEEPTFLDHIRGGLQLHFTVAVDFTASNGHPAQPNSLHFWDPRVENQYATAIRSVGEIIQDYDSDKQFQALGFGGRVPPDFKVSHEFFLNGRVDSPYCAGVQGILEAYRHSLATVGLYGPTNFAPVIKHVANFARSLLDGKNYFVLLIITDGCITDLPATREALVMASALPMSVIIVGVGNEDFSAMEQLDGDDRRLSHNGQYAVRDIVQFVELRRFLSGPAGGGPASSEVRAAMAAAVLHELPAQLCDYLRQRNPPHAEQSS
ncbi:copine-8 isoform X2 [Hyalella azteca]|uniref:Copine-3 n=1 Tax=Hyalella azteca TaxID=294128 RepID=A0A8B7NJH7_HYAAZ|nr:copine-8 isoform X2 [Hyalella azteca]